MPLYFPSYCSPMAPQLHPGQGRYLDSFFDILEDVVSIKEPEPEPMSLLDFLNVTGGPILRPIPARRAAPPPFAPRFDVHETKTGYELHGELPGVERENLRIEFTDDDALVISGHVGPAASPLNEKKTPAVTTSKPEPTPGPQQEEPQRQQAAAATPLSEAEDEDLETRSVSSMSSSSTTGSKKSFQATVEDDFEDEDWGSIKAATSTVLTPAETSRPAIPKTPETKSASSTPAPAPTPAAKTTSTPPVAAAKKPATTTTSTETPKKAPAAAAAAAAAAAPRQWQTERSLGEFSRRFLFAQKVDRDAISAGLHNGVLVVSVPKAKRFQPRRIVVV